MGTLGHAATGPVAFGASVRPYEAAKPKSADRTPRVSVCLIKGMREHFA